MIFNGIDSYNKYTYKELISTKYTDSFSYNRNNYIELYV